jgi:hypothetical protein
MTSDTSAPLCDVLTIGHSNLAADRFIALLQQAGVSAIADVRSLPFSRWCPWFSRKPLTERLASERMGYLAFGDALGGRPQKRQLYRDGVADYEAMAATLGFRAALERLTAAIGRHRVCLLCAEREPLDCHRCLLVGRALAEGGLRLVISAPTARSSRTRRPKNGCSSSWAPKETCSATAPLAWPRPTAVERVRSQHGSRPEPTATERSPSGHESRGRILALPSP